MLKMTKLICVSTMLACLAILSCTASAQTWDLAGDFSTTVNPNGPWDYGALAYPDTHQDFWHYAVTYSLAFPNQIVGWGAWMSGATCKNVTGGDFQPWNNPVFMEQDAMFIMPTSGSNPGGTTNMIAQKFTAAQAGIYHVHGRFYGLAATYSQGIGYGGVRVIKGEYDNSANQTLYSHEMLHTDWLNGNVAGGGHVAKGTNPESFFDVFVRLEAGMPVVFASGDKTNWDWMRIGLDATIDAVTDPVGLVKGKVTDTYSGLPISGAVVSVVGGASTTTTDAYGKYYFLLPAGGYSLEASGVGYQLATAGVTVTLNQESVVNFALNPATRWVLADDFSTVNNPNGPWDVGAIDTALNFASYGNMPYDFEGVGYGHLVGWGAWGSGAVIKNVSGGDYVPWMGGHWVPKDGMFMGPTSSGTDQMAVAWTSPVTGVVSVMGRVYGATIYAAAPTTQGTNTGPVRILKEGGPVLASASIDGGVAGGGNPAVGPNPEELFGLTVNVTTGDKLLFGFGDNTVWDTSRFGADVDIEVVSEPTGFVRGTVTSSISAHPPVAGVTVNVVGASTTVETNQMGEYLLKLPVGNYTLEIGCPSYVSQTTSVTVADGATTTKNFELTLITNWNLAGDFSSDTNPYGQWVYGYVPAASPLGDLHAYTTKYGVGGGCLGWGEWLLGAVNKNVSGGDLWLWLGIWLREDGMHIFPGVGPRAATRWTSPLNDTVAISATFMGNGGNAGTIATSDVHVLKNGVEIWSGYVNGRVAAPGYPAAGVAPTQTYADQITVSYGDTIDFVIGDGGNGREGTGKFDYLDLDASIYIPVTASTPGEAKNQPDGTVVKIATPQVVTAGSDVFGYSGDVYYIEDENRTSGIKVVPASAPASVALGDRVTMTAEVKTDVNGERMLRVISLDSQIPGTPLDPVGMTGKATTVGLETEGLLIKLWGNVTYSDLGGMLYFYLDDGSGLQDGGANSGIRVLIDGGEWTDPIGMRYPGQYVAVTGLLGKGASGIPVLRPRGEADMKDF